MKDIPTTTVPFNIKTDYIIQLSPNLAFTPCFCSRQQPLIEFNLIPTEDDFHKITTHFNINKVLLNLKILQVMLWHDPKNGTYGFGHEYSLLEGIAGYIPLEKVCTSYSDLVAAIKDVLRTNLRHANEIVAYCLRVLNY